MIPEAAVEAALVAIFPKGPISEFSRTTWTRTVHEILEAAAPHMLAEAKAAGWDEGWEKAQDYALAANPYREGSENG